ncbi:uncharacterized protein LOC129587236 isoform X1 [Paramacrobiotus metropolitanus]|uniref:uncharacterized protein LOC129587236 isoform X1 n=1 Tax=Paramacrobiotus metropolitanus TaxID=2943436 RepID=UPI0024462C1A|nr:uncharacterized protein LOC129587236 isoform X1 [Paramacrobiotus metropolitanus]
MCDSTVLSPSEHEEDLGIWERQSVGAAPTMDRMSHSDATPSAQSSPGNSRSNQEPLHGVTEATLPSDQGRGSAENMEKVAADSTRPWLKFCAALERPADKVRNVKKLSIRDKIRLRRSTTTNMDHVLLMGTVSFVLDPLACPYAEEEACKKFFATSPSFLKAHLQNKHDLKNVLLNFVCPCPAKCNARKECATVLFDPSHMNSHMTAHLERRHRKYYEAMCVALLSAEPLPGEDPEKVKTRLYYRERARRFTFPAWTREKDKMFPSQIIPDRIIIPTEIHRRGDGVIKYICNIDPCSDSHTAIGDGGPQAAFNMHVHMLLEHGKRYGLTSTRFYHKCPACGELINAADNQLETHVKALHEELLLGGHRGEFSEDAQKVCPFLRLLVRLIMSVGLLAKAESAGGQHSVPSHRRRHHQRPAAGRRPPRQRVAVPAALHLSGQAVRQRVPRGRQGAGVHAVAHPGRSPRRLECARDRDRSDSRGGGLHFEFT